MTKKIFLALIFGLVLSGCTVGKKADAPVPKPEKKQLVNALPYSERPFVVLFPHSTGKMLTIYMDRLAGNYTEATFDIEYLAGNSLKGGRTAVRLPAKLPFTQAFLLGSCSTGGKCSFDKDLQNGTIKTKLDSSSQQIQVLKSDYVFLKNIAVTTPDGRVVYTPASTKKVPESVLIDTQGLPAPLDGQLAYGPIAIAKTESSPVKATLKFNLSGVTAVKIFDGVNFVPLKADIATDKVTINLSQTPWSKDMTIIRDDMGGSSESLTSYLVGPIVFIK